MVQEPQLRLPQRIQLAHLLLPKILIELLHQDLGRLVGHLPQAGYRGPRAGHLKCPLNTEQPFTTSALALAALCLVMSRRRAF